MSSAACVKFVCIFKLLVINYKTFPILRYSVFCLTCLSISVDVRSFGVIIRWNSAFSRRHTHFDDSTMQQHHDDASKNRTENMKETWRGKKWSKSFFFLWILFFDQWSLLEVFAGANLAKNFWSLLFSICGQSLKLNHAIPRTRQTRTLSIYRTSTEYRPVVIAFGSTQQRLGAIVHPLDPFEYFW